MSRGAAGDVIVQRPSSDIYTVLAAAAVVALLLGLLCVYMRAKDLHGGLFPDPNSGSTSAAGKR